MKDKAIELYGDQEDDLAVFRSNLSDVEAVETMDDEKQNLIIFDDFINEKNQSVVDDYFTMGRKKNCSVIYISHSYFDTPRSLRLNSDYIALFKFNNKGEISNFKREFPLDISNEEFAKKYRDCIKTKHGFLFIDKNASDPNLRYRKNLDNK